MTAYRLQSIVMRLANQCPTRYWLHWNYPSRPIVMAIEVPGTTERFRSDMAELGFEQSDRPGPHGGVLFTVERDQEDMPK